MPSVRARLATLVRPAGTAPLVVVRQAASHGTGLLRPWAARRGLDLRVVRLDRGEALPAVPDDGAVVLLGTARAAGAGSPALRRWTAGLIARDVPVLGLGTGAHLPLTLLGGEVHPAAEPEVGWTTVFSGDAALAAGPWLAWRHDAVSVPSEVAVTAFNAHGPQAFACGSAAGVLLHPHATPEMVARWAAAVEDYDDVRAQAREHADRHRAAAFALLDGWAGRARVRTGTRERVPA